MARTFTLSRRTCRPRRRGAREKDGTNGLELACWGDHFDIDRAAADKKRWASLSDHGLTPFAISAGERAEIVNEVCPIEAADHKIGCQPARE